MGTSGCALCPTMSAQDSSLYMRMVRWAMPTLILRTPRYRRKSCV
uniref:Alternative protein PARP6 n=1 Tax=Homo sapiens TaxID=9606 RepID=L8EB14_HUMAN|nr:alternative protein PARP6 [Homo sapiens]